MSKEDKKATFIFYKDWYNMARKQRDGTRLKLYDAICQYVFDGTTPADPSIEMAFDLIKDQIDRDAEKYDAKIEKRREAGRKHSGNQYTRAKEREAEQGGTNGTSVPKMEQNGTNGTDNTNGNANTNNNEFSLNGKLPLTGGCRSQSDSTETKKKKPALVHRARAIFEKQYEEIFEQSYYWTAKDAASMKLLIQKITYARKKRQQDVDEESLLSALQAFLNTIGSEWLLENYTVTKINGQYNEIVARAKAKMLSNGNNRTGTTKEQMYDDAAELVSELLTGNG